MTALGTIRHPGEGRTVAIGADRLTIKGVSGVDAFSVMEYEAVAGVAGPPPHAHRAAEEAIFMLDGEVEFHLNGHTTLLRPGAFALVPAGSVHTFANVGAGPARWLGIFAPGHYLRLVEELAAILPPVGPPDPVAVAEIFARWDTDLAVPV